MPENLKIAWKSNTLWHMSIPITPWFLVALHWSTLKPPFLGAYSNLLRNWSYSADLPHSGKWWFVTVLVFLVKVTPSLLRRRSLARHANSSPTNELWLVNLGERKWLLVRGGEFAWRAKKRLHRRLGNTSLPVEIKCTNSYWQLMSSNNLIAIFKSCTTIILFSITWNKLSVRLNLTLSYAEETGMRRIKSLRNLRCQPWGTFTKKSMGHGNLSFNFLPTLQGPFLDSTSSFDFLVVQGTSNGAVLRLDADKEKQSPLEWRAVSIALSLCSRFTSSFFCFNLSQSASPWHRISPASFADSQDQLQQKYSK